MNNDINFIRKELDHLQTKVKDFDVVTQYAYSSSDTVPPSDDAIWFDEKPVPWEGCFIWARNIMNMGYGDIITEPFCIGDGLEHILGLDVEYIAWNDPYNAPSQDNPNWQTVAPSIQSGMYIWTRSVINTTHGTSYTSPVRITGLQGERGTDGVNGKAGRDGKGIEFIFKRYASQINWNNPPSGVVNPSTLSPVQTDDYVPNGWTDDQEEVTEALSYQYVSTRTKSTSGEATTGEWSGFNTPRLWSVYGEKPYCHIRYADVNNPQNWNQTYPNPQTSGQGEVTYHKYEGYLWNSDEVLQDVDKDPTKFSWRIYRPTIGIAGEEGSFLHIQYADDESGTNMNQYDGAYMGTCVTWEEVDPDDPDLYNWVRIRGTEGVGTEFVYFTTNSASYSSLPSNIQNTPAPLRWCERPYAVSEQYQYCYISIREYTDEQWGSWSSPVLWAKYGSTGQTGSAGEDGSDGEGLEMIFARNNSTTTAPTFSNGQNRASYTGTDSQGRHYQDTDFTPNGWTDNQSGVTASQSVEWVCMRFKRCPSGSKDGVWGDFNTPRVWATFSEDGRGVTSIVEQYALGTSYTVAPTTGWSNTPPTNQQGKFYWTRSVITYDDGTSTTTNPICVSGIDGTGVHYVYYVTNTLSTPTTPTWSDINHTTPSNPYDKWLEDPYPVDANHKYIYISESTTYVQSNNSWSNFSTPAVWSRYAIDGTNGTNGTNGQGYEYAYYTSNSATVPTKPSGSVTATSGYNKWTNVPVAMTSTYKYMYISYRTKTGTTYTAWSNTALWSQFGDKGDQGARGSDGTGLEHIFYRTNTASPTWNNTTNPSKWTVQPNTDEYILSGSGWTDDPQGVTDSARFEFVAIRTKTPNSSGVGQWGAYTSPSLWAKYGEKGDQGNKGDTGDDGDNGVDGNNITPSTVLDKNSENNLSGTTVGGIANQIASDFMSLNIQESASYNSYSYIADTNYVFRFYKIGRFVFCNYDILLLNTMPKENYSKGTIGNLPNWAVPVFNVYLPNILAHINGARIRFTADGKIQVWNATSTTTGSTNLAGSTFYLAKDGASLTPTTLSFGESSVAQGQALRVLMKINGSNAPSGYIVYIRVNGVVYRRVTDSNGYVYLNMNLPMSHTGDISRAFSVTAWYDGLQYTSNGNYDKINTSMATSTITSNITVNKCISATITFGGSGNKCYARVMNGNYPIRYHDVTISYNGHSFIGNTDSEGYVYFNLDNYVGKSVRVTCSIANSTRCSAKTSSSNMTP